MFVVQKKKEATPKSTASMEKDVNALLAEIATYTKSTAEEFKLFREETSGCLTSLDERVTALEERCGTTHHCNKETTSGAASPGEIKKSTAAATAATAAATVVMESASSGATPVQPIRTYKGRVYYVLCHGQVQEIIDDKELAKAYSGLENPPSSPVLIEKNERGEKRIAKYLSATEAESLRK